MERIVKSANLQLEHQQSRSPQTALRKLPEKNISSNRQVQTPALRAAKLGNLNRRHTTSDFTAKNRSDRRGSRQFIKGFSRAAAAEVTRKQRDSAVDPDDNHSGSFRNGKKNTCDRQLIIFDNPQPSRRTKVAECRLIGLDMSGWRASFPVWIDHLNGGSLSCIRWTCSTAWRTIFGCACR